jgi:PAS domain S-box-containing protein
MSDVASQLALLRDSRLAAHATSAAPVWLWSTDATRILWANPVGAAIFGAPTPAAIAERRFDPRDEAATQIARVVGSLRLGGAPRLERLRGFGTGLWRALTCSCARITLSDHRPGILIVALEPAGPALPLPERIRRLYDGTAVATFAPEGKLVYAAPEARTRLGGATTLAALGAGQIAEAAMIQGRAEGEIPLGRLKIERLGADATTVLAATVTVTDPAAAARPVIAPPLTPEPAPTSEQPALAEPPGEAPSAGEPPSDRPARVERPHVAKPSVVTAAAGPPPAPPLVPAAPDTTATEQPGPPPAEDRPPPPLRIDVPIPERRHPLRFVWQMDAGGRFTLGSEEFTEVIGPSIAIALGRLWSDINTELALDPEGQVARAVATRDTWSGITVSWPVEGSADRLKVELSGLPIYDRNRNFLGYRGFGVCRDIDRITTLAMMRRSSFIAAPSAPNASTAPVSAEPDARPTLSVVPSAPNVVPFRSPTPSAEPKMPALSQGERNAFHELARQLTARLKDGGDEHAGEPAREAGVQAAAMRVAEPAPARAPSEEATAEITKPAYHATTTVVAEAPGMTASVTPVAVPPPAEPAGGSHATTAPASDGYSVTDIADELPAHGPAERPLLDRLPIGILVYRLDTLLYANRAFLDWTGYEHLDALTEAGGLDGLFVEGGSDDLGEPGDAGKTLAIATPRGDKLPVEGRLHSLPWNRENALVLMLLTTEANERHKATEGTLRVAEAQARELKAVLDTATDGIVVIEPDGRIVTSNRSAEALFGYDAAEFATRNFADLFAPESRPVALDYLATLMRGGGVSGLINDGREIIGQARQGGTIALSMALGRVTDQSSRVCAVFRDMTTWKKTARELIAARQEAERASAAKSDFLAKISHEIRTPLNSIVGFSEVMLDERFGPIGNERYRDYLKDIRGAGDHVVSLLNDLLDLSKIEAGKLELELASLNLNEVVQGCVALMQPQANRERIIIRTSLSPTLRPVTADARSVRQIVLNLLSNSVKFTGAGGQVIVSTAQSDAGEVSLRVRDTGIGMDDKELTVALEPFRQLATAARWGAGGTGLGLPLTRALAEANHARFTITSKVNDGTLVEVAFPATPVTVK